MFLRWIISFSLTRRVLNMISITKTVEVLLNILLDHTVFHHFVLINRVSPSGGQHRGWSKSHVVQQHSMALHRQQAL